MNILGKGLSQYSLCPCGESQIVPSLSVLNKSQERLTSLTEPSQLHTHTQAKSKTSKDRKKQSCIECIYRQSTTLSKIPLSLSLSLSSECPLHISLLARRYHLRAQGHYSPSWKECALPRLMRRCWRFSETPGANDYLSALHAQITQTPPRRDSLCVAPLYLRSMLKDFYLHDAATELLNYSTNPAEEKALFCVQVEKQNSSPIISK